jgi:hypothetical protein
LNTLSLLVAAALDFQARVVAVRVVIALQLVLVLLLTQTTLSRLVRVVQKAEPTQVIKQTGQTLSSLRLPQRAVAKEGAVDQPVRQAVQRVEPETQMEP